MANTRSDIIEQIEDAPTLAIKKHLVDALWDHAREKGTPLIAYVDGKYQALFLFQSDQADLNVRLKSADLHDRLIKDSKDGQTKKFENIPGTNIYYLKVDDLPADACAEYSIQIGDVPNEKYVSDPYNNHQATKQNLHFSSDNHSTVVNESASYMLMPKATMPMTLDEKSSSEISLAHENFHSDKYTMFQDRDVFMYKSDNFDPATGKVIFMLDGKDFCESITPGLLAINNNSSSSLSNTAIVFIDSKFDKLKHLYGEFDYKPYPWKDDMEIGFIPERVYEFYFRKKDFSSMLVEEIIPLYSKQLGVEHPEQIILAAHSLAAYPVIDVATNHASDIGGVILISPALNQNQLTGFPDKPNESLQSLPIYMQIGQLEDTKPPVKDQQEQDMTNQSRLDANRNAHRFLRNNAYNVSSTLQVHSYGHANIHALHGLEDGMKHVQEHQISLEQKSTLSTTASLSTVMGSGTLSPSMQESPPDKTSTSKDKLESTEPSKNVKNEKVEKTPVTSRSNKF